MAVVSQNHSDYYTCFGLVGYAVRHGLCKKPSNAMNDEDLCIFVIALSMGLGRAHVHSGCGSAVEGGGLVG
eukprot:scaffold6286_cov82-Skeletonema_menzelii.AAC.8